VKSPFEFGRVVSDFEFTNRSHEISRLTVNFENGINTILVSPRRWGKSSLVKKVADQINSKKQKIIILDLLPVRNEEEFYSRFSTAIIKSTSTKFEEWIQNAKLFLSRINPKFSIGTDPVNDFEVKLELEGIKKNYQDILQLPEKLAQQKKIKLIICIDEFQNIAVFDNPLLFQKRLRSEWQHQKNVTYCLYGSREHMMMQLFEKQSMPFYKFGETMHLEKIKEEHWKTFIVQAFKRSKKNIHPDLAGIIANTVQCHPYYVQQLSHLAWIKTTKSATTEIIKSAIDDLIDQNALLYLKETEDLSDTQLNFLKAVASGAILFSSKDTIQTYQLGTSANVVKVKATLLNREIIEVRSNKVSFIDPAYELWFKKYILKKPVNQFAI
jgi:hypothetical protein